MAVQRLPVTRWSRPRAWLGRALRYVVVLLLGGKSGLVDLRDVHGSEYNSGKQEDSPRVLASEPLLKAWLQRSLQCRRPSVSIDEVGCG